MRLRDLFKKSEPIPVVESCRELCAEIGVSRGDIELHTADPLTEALLLELLDLVKATRNVS